jgi:betaine-aldehyde dehydrogenase
MKVSTMSGLPHAAATTRSADLFIGGQWVHSSDGGVRESINPADGSIVAVVDEATPDDAARAVAAARAAFDGGPWPTLGAAERVGLLGRIADLLVRDKEQLALLETADTGKTLVESRIDIDDVVSVFRYYASLLAAGSDRLVDVGDPHVISRVVREPIGVCVLIAPWNYPLLQISWKVAPALAAGCTMVLKPSEVTPLSTIAFTRLIEEARVPAGVVNLVQGSGARLGAALTDTPDVDFISFTGGLATGRTITRTAATHVTKVAVELGGKNPHIVFPDADWESSVDQVLTGVFLHSGQVCSAGTRLIVHESIADDFVAELATRAEQIRLGNGLDPASQTGPLVSEQQREKIEGFVALGLSEGAKLVTGGARPSDPRLSKGCYFLPTIFDQCDRSMRIVQEETFGPILTVERFSTPEQAIALGNDTEYGLAAGVRTADAALGERVARALRHGTVWINDFGYYTAAAEWGGYKKSGNGRELGPAGLAEYQELKHIWQRTAPAPTGWFTSPV